MCAEYGWAPNTVASMTAAQVEYFTHWLPLIAARNHYGVAKLTANIKNMMGGKPDPNDKTSKPLAPERMFTTEEELPFFAWMGERNTTAGLDVETARLLLRISRALPSWAVQGGLLERAQTVAR